MKPTTPVPLPATDAASTGRMVLLGVWLRLAGIGVCTTAAGAVILVRQDTGFSTPGALAFAAAGAMLATYAARRVRSLLAPADATAPQAAARERSKSTSSLAAPALAER